MKEIKREEIITSPGEWNPSILDNTPDESELQRKQFPPTPIDATDDVYDMEGNIIVQKNHINGSSIVSDVSSTSSGSRRRLYWARSRKEKQK